MAILEFLTGFLGAAAQPTALDEPLGRADEIVSGQPALTTKAIGETPRTRRQSCTGSPRS